MIERNLLAVFLLLGLLFTTTTTSKLTDTPVRTPLAESRVVKRNGVSIHYENYGRGTRAIVFIHGWTCNLNQWRAQLPEFAKRARVIAIDLPGHGQSDKPQIKYDMDLFASAVDAVLTDAKVSEVVLVGHSMGFLVARQFYRKHPTRTRAMVDVDCPLRRNWNKARTEELIATLRGSDFRNALTNMFGKMMGSKLSDAAKSEILSSSLNTPQHVVVSALESMEDSSSWGNDKIKVPVLAILSKDSIYPSNIEIVYRDIASQLDIHIWEGVGHFLMMERPDAFNQTVSLFLEKKNLLKR